MGATRTRLEKGQISCHHYTRLKRRRLHLEDFFHFGVPSPKVASRFGRSWAGPIAFMGRYFGWAVVVRQEKLYLVQTSFCQHFRPVPFEMLEIFCVANRYGFGTLPANLVI
jgi:hypothetical protein